MKQPVLINRNFAFLWSGKIISQIGDKFYALALAWWILQKTDSSGIMGFFLLVSVLPGLVLGLFAGAMTDRLNRKHVLIITDILRGFLILLVVLLSFLHILVVWHVFIIGAALSLVTAFFDPAVQAVLPQLVDREHLKKANSMNQMVSGICTILGPILGAVAISHFSVTPVFLFNGISYLISAILSKMLILNTANGMSHKKNTVVTDMKDGILFLRNNRGLLRIISIIAFAHFFMGSLMVMMPFLAKSLSGNGVQNLGSMETFLGIGLLLGALYIRGMGSPSMSEKTLNYIILTLGVSFLFVSLLQFISSESIFPYLPVFLLIGCGLSGGSVYWQSLLQLNTPDYMTGRVFSVSSLAGNASLPIAFGVYGLLMISITIKLLMLFSGLCLVLLSILFLLPRRRHKQQLPI
jgi:MFS transporter, DHA3 family, macrolide efflux protein